MTNQLLRKDVLTFLLLIMSINVNAQIYLHKASDITQTKATLSADFTNCDESLIFKHLYYKEGMLPTIDDFSKLALDSISEPIQLSTTGKKWSARTVKGWVESNKELSAGESSTMSTTVRVYAQTQLSFEWSVDSEEDYGILSFSIDGTVIQEISGYVDFTKVSHKLTAGEHTLQWTYTKKSATNVGLDLGMVRNIHIENTTAGTWKKIAYEGEPIQLTNLKPGKDYLFKATAADYTSVTTTRKVVDIIQLTSIPSPIKTFKTLNVTVGDITVDTTTQTTATLSSSVDLGDADATVFIALRKGWPEWSDPELLQYGFAAESHPCSLVTNSGWTGDTKNNYLKSTSTTPLTIEVDLLEPASLTFDIRMSNSSHTTSLKVDGKQLGTIKAYDWKTYKYELTAGKHTISWNRTVSGGTLYLRNIKIGENTWTTHPMSANTLTELRPNTIYSGTLFVLNNVNNDTLYQSPVFDFTTKPLVANNLSCKNLKQASVTLKGYVYGGDATIVATGLQYKDSDGTRWTDYAKETSANEHSQQLTRLKPNTTYNYRTYIQAQDCDTTFSETGTFTTLAVVPDMPDTKDITQHSATIQGCVHFGDASIYQYGLQLRKNGETEWETYEASGNDSIITLTRNDLEMGVLYYVRTFVQPAGGNIIYSDYTGFRTWGSYFAKTANKSTQTTVTLFAYSAPKDDWITIEETGFEYFISGDGFFEDWDNFIPSDTIRVQATPAENGDIQTTITGLAPLYYLRYRAYAKVDGVYHYTASSYAHDNWEHANTDWPFINIEVEKLTQTSITLNLDATQTGDAVVTQIEYAIVESREDSAEYRPCGNKLELTNLQPNTTYVLRFRGTVNGLLCPLLTEDGPDYSWYPITTKPISITPIFTDITQTKATMEIEAEVGDAEVEYLQGTLTDGLTEQTFDVLPNEDMHFENLIPGRTYAVLINCRINGIETLAGGNFTTLFTTATVETTEAYQTSAKIEWKTEYGDATYVTSGIMYGTSYNQLNNQIESDKETTFITELLPNSTYYYRAYLETEEGGIVYTKRDTFTTTDISCTTLPASSLSNRSATMNGTIDCDSYSSAEFGFVWKQMTGWESEPAFTKGVKNEDGSISVALVNGMLEPNTDYQYMTAVRYQDSIYTANAWQTFRTESEFVYYQATVHTLYRTDRENNSIVLCGYYIAGSEDIVSQGYEYWSNSKQRNTPDIIRITTNESMQHNLDITSLDEGTYSLRAFVTTSANETIYGETLAFSIVNGEVVGIDGVDTDEDNIEIIGYFDLNGRKLNLPQRGINIIRYSNGTSKKVYMK